MKRVKALLPILFVFASIAAIAQPTFIFETLEVTSGDQFCMKVQTRDFTDLLTIKKTFEWDPSVIRFTGISGLTGPMNGFDHLDMSDFDDSDAGDGRLHLDWTDIDNSGTTIPAADEDTHILFEICFESIGTFGASTQVCVAKDPDPIVTRLGTGGINIGCMQEKGLVGTDVLPVELCPNMPEPNQGDFFCVDYTVFNFRKIVGMQFTIEFDHTVLEYDGVANYELRGLNRNNVQQPRDTDGNLVPGRLTFSWFDSQGPSTLADGTVAFGICFRAIGDCDDFSFVRITSEFTKIEVISGDEPPPAVGINIGVVAKESLVRINSCNQNGGLTLSTDCPEVMPGDLICVEVEADGFTDLVETDFLVKWNATVLEYQSHDLLSGFAPNVDVNGTNIGTLKIFWKSRTPTASQTIPNGSNIMRLCFRVIGDGTVNSNISFTGSPAFIQQRGSNNNYGLVAQNGCVKVNAPPGLTLSADEYERFKGEQVCVPVKVANFNAINFTKFSINYASNIVQFDVPKNFNIPRMDMTNFNDDGNGNIEVIWDADRSGFGESLSDGDTAFELCFTVIGDPTSPPALQNCSIIDFSGDPTSVEITAEDSGDFNIGLNSNPGKICVLDPGDFTIVASHEVGSLDEVVCVDVKAVNIIGVTKFQFSANWNDGPGDPIVEFVDVQFPGSVPGLTNSNFDFARTGVGILSVSWTDDTGQGLNLPDSTSLFQVCFKIVGDANQCTAFGFAKDPLDQIVETTFSNGNNVGLNSFNGSVCTGDYLRINEATLQDVGCPGSNSGAIFLSIRGGVPDYDYQWSGGIATNDRNVENLAEGMYSVTITDKSTPPRTVIDTFEIALSGTAPMAIAGDDRSMNCNNLPIVLDGDGSSAGSNIRYEWTSPDTGGVLAPSNETLEPTVTSAGTYILEVLDMNTNCVAFDTVVVTPPNSQEVAEAGDNVMLTCIDTVAILDATNSTGDNLRFLWKAINGGMLQSGTDSTAFATAMTPGRFELTITNRFTGCMSNDTVEVFPNSAILVADAGPQMAIPCRADTIIIGGATTSTGPNITYQWVEVDGGNIIAGATESAASVNSNGLYQLFVLDTITGCLETDTVSVIGDPNRPVSDAGDDLSLTCDLTSVKIESQNSSQGGQYSYFWEAFAGGVLTPGEETMLQPTVSDPGLYQLTVVNIGSGCSSISSMTVSGAAVYPTAQAGADVDIGCQIVDVPIEGIGSSTGSQFTYQWTTNGIGIIRTPNSLTTNVAGPGMYFLEVTNTDNGCSAKDTMNIFQDTTRFKPNIEIQAGQYELNCADSVVTLNAIGSDSGTGFITQWGPAQNIVSGSNTLTPLVNAVGIYTLSIIHDSTGCNTSATVEVTEDFAVPFATILQDTVQLPCDPAEVQISGSGSDAGPGFSFVWTHSNPSSIQNPNSLATVVTELGIYTFTVTNNGNGCSADTSVYVRPAPSALIADAGGSTVFDCNNSEFVWDGGTTSTDPGLIYEWINTDDGSIVSDTLGFTFTEAGTYVLNVSNDIGCQSVDTLFITEDMAEPMVEAGDIQSFVCFFDGATLDGSFDAGSANVNFIWTSPDGNPISDPNSLNPIVNDAGLYILSVENTDNGCSSSDSVLIEINSVNLEPATADFDAGMCDNFAMLNANLPQGSIGTWSSPSGAMVDDPANPMAMANDLTIGTTVFIWTLSTDDCPDYSQDSVFVEISGVGGDLTLRNDLITINENQDSVEIDYVSNDDIDPASNWSITLLDSLPTGIMMDPSDGSFTFVKSTDDDFNGTFDLNYEVCNLDCPDQCDTAVIKITVFTKEDTISTIIPNAITPNGDGMNDALEFDVLDKDPDRYPNNELVVFNRWGDVVYKVRPYQNEWQGTNLSGKALPHGTYYYILRLSVAEGTIFRGDVTILR